MNESEARAESKRRNDADGGAGIWIACVADDRWTVAQVTAPGLAPMKATGSHSEARPRPLEPDDPRPSILRNIPPYGPGI